MQNSLLQTTERPLPLRNLANQSSLRVYVNATFDLNDTLSSYGAVKPIVLQVSVFQRADILFIYSGIYDTDTNVIQFHRKKNEIYKNNWQLIIVDNRKKNFRPGTGGYLKNCSHPVQYCD